FRGGNSAAGCSVGLHPVGNNGRSDCLTIRRPSARHFLGSEARFLSVRNAESVFLHEPVAREWVRRSDRTAANGAVACWKCDSGVCAACAVPGAAVPGRFEGLPEGHSAPPCSLLPFQTTCFRYCARGARAWQAKNSSWPGGLVPWRGNNPEKA